MFMSHLFLPLLYLWRLGALSSFFCRSYFWLTLAVSLVYVTLTVKRTIGLNGRHYRYLRATWSSKYVSHCMPVTLVTFCDLILISTFFKYGLRTLQYPSWTFTSTLGVCSLQPQKRRLPRQRPHVFSLREAFCVSQMSQTLPPGGGGGRNAHIRVMYAHLNARDVLVSASHFFVSKALSLQSYS